MDAEFQEDDGVRRVNHYILKREIGRGSFGVVHLGVDSNTGEEFVLIPSPHPFRNTLQATLDHSRLVR